MTIIKINAMWCSGCLSMHKVWKTIEAEYPNINFVSYDYDMDEDIVKTYNPGDVLPVTIFLKDDKEVARLNGEKTVADIENIIENIR